MKGPRVSFYWYGKVVFPLAMGCLTSPLSAQDQRSGEKVEELETIEVVAPAPGSPTTPTVAPSTVDTISERTVEERDIMNLRQAIELVPNVFTNQADSARASSFAIRGSREITFHELGGGRSSAAYYVDDIPSLDAYGRDLTLFAVENISIYKGPHGTQFGAPGPLGVFDVTTRRPGPDTEAEFSYTYGSNELHRGIFHTSGAILPNLFIGIDGLYARDEGWYEDELTGDAYGKHETTSGRIKLVWEATNQLELTLTAGASYHDDDPVVYLPFTTDALYKVHADPDASATGRQSYEALRAVWKEDEWQLKSITSHRSSDFEDEDNALLVEVFFPGSSVRERDQEITAWTQEIRAESTNPDAEWRWRTGLFLSRRESSLDHFITGIREWEGGNEVNFDQEEWALYGEITRPIGNHLELSGGLRLQTSRDHTFSSFDPTAFASSLGGVPFETDDRDHYNAALPMAAASWKWSAEQRSYLRFSTGMQPGGLAVAAGGSQDYDSERSLHYELGHDSSFHEGLVTLHGAAFYTHYKDYQAFQFNPTGGQTIYNADRAHAWGAEAAILIRATEEIEFSAGLGYTQARYDDYEAPIGDFTGNRIAKIPECTLNLGVSYRAKWGGMARIDWRYIGDTAFDDANRLTQGAYSLLDARIGYEKGNYGIYVFGRNLCDTEYFTHSYLFFGRPASTGGTPRIIGTEIRATF